MKKLVSLVLAVILSFSVLSLVSCGNNEEKLSLGIGVVTEQKGSDATAEKNGSAQADVTMAAVLVDKDGKIVAVKIDTAQNKVAFTADGIAVKNDSFKTKIELGNDYGMSAIGKQEWYVQVAALEGVLVGKTLTEVTALVAEDGKGVEAVQTAGCTVTVSELIEAVAKAIKSAKPSDATAKDTLKIAAVTTQSVSDATADKAGKNEVDTTMAAVVTNADKKVVAVVTDVQQVKFAFDVAGKFTTDVTAALKTKTELGNDYGMSAIGKQEWYIQNEAFDALCLGKTADEISKLVAEDGKGVEAVQTAGCTVTVSELVEAIVKGAK